jgi:hypothetical protein
MCFVGGANQIYTMARLRLDQVGNCHIPRIDGPVDWEAGSSLLELYEAPEWLPRKFEEQALSEHE